MYCPKNLLFNFLITVIVKLEWIQPLRISFEVRQTTVQPGRIFWEELSVRAHFTLRLLVPNFYIIVQVKCTVEKARILSLIEQGLDKKSEQIGIK